MANIQTGRGIEQFSFGLPDDLRRQIAVAAKSSGRSMNTEIIARLDASFSTENQSPEADAKQTKADEVQKIANHSEPARPAGEGSNNPAPFVQLDRRLFLTVPHFTNAEQSQTKANQERILVVCGGPGDGNGHSSNNERNGPLAIIAKFLGIHIRKAPFAEFHITLHLDNQGVLTQEVRLPANWFLLET